MSNLMNIRPTKTHQTINNRQLKTDNRKHTTP